MSQDAIFHPYTFGEEERKTMDKDGHFVFPGLLVPDAQEQLQRALSHIQTLARNP